jgi:hypothetical protein
MKVKKFPHLRVGFGWMYPVAEEGKMFTVGIKMYLLAPRDKIVLTSTSTTSTPKLIQGLSRSLTGPCILVPRRGTYMFAEAMLVRLVLQ